MEFVVSDVQTGGLGPEPFDLAVSQLGVMFFDEPLAAFGAIRAGLRAGRAPRLRLLAGGGAEPVAHGHGAAPVRPAAHASRLRARARWARSASATTSTCATSWAAPGSATSRAPSVEITVRAPASAVVDRSLFGFMGVAAERLEEAEAALDRHLERFAVGDGEYEYPLAFRVYEAVNGLMAGYSGTPAAQEAGDRRGVDAGARREPSGVVDGLPAGVTVKRQARGKADVVVAFFTERRDFERRIDALGRMIFPAGGLWVAWPKRSSGRATTMDENVVRAVALPLGLVDNKVCAIDETWSGLRVVWRRERR